MKHRSALFLVLMILVAGSTAFASGKSEPTALADRWETITVTGTVSFKDWPNPEITSGRTTYELLVPRFAIEDLDVASGDEITVEGIAVDTNGNEDEPLLMVVKATIDGEEYEVPTGMRGGMGMDFRSGDRSDMNGFGGRGGFSGDTRRLMKDELTNRLNDRYGDRMQGRR